MAKGCLDKLTGNITLGCGVTPPGVSDIYLMYTDDVTFTFTDLNRAVSAVTFASGAKSYRIEGYKQNVQVTAALRSLDASTKFDVSVMFKIANTDPNLWNRLIGGRVYVLEVPNAAGTNFNIWGVNTPLECTGFEYDSNANGKLATVTLSAPEGSAGNLRIYCAASVKDSIIAKSV